MGHLQRGNEVGAPHFPQPTTDLSDNSSWSKLELIGSAFTIRKLPPADFVILCFSLIDMDSFNGVVNTGYELAWRIKAHIWSAVLQNTDLLLELLGRIAAITS
ncbi:hypothetical protein HAX54_040051 [Datura stramonium]|uniref:Uncharacterized protein n=1 Tax=Datura stramonium TaxID=4076 RepID=A0ABS8SJJ9_DATST|nr:hypothetical protein [Datura stramonium]